MDDDTILTYKLANSLWIPTPVYTRTWRGVGLLPTLNDLLPLPGWVIQGAQNAND